jgi:hypothetical protein
MSATLCNNRAAAASFASENAGRCKTATAACECVKKARFAFALVFTALVVGCADGGAAFSSKLASDFRPAQHTVSVLGVYQDGRMSLDSWDNLAPYLARALGSAKCPIGYDALVSSNQELANAIDEFARDEGPTGTLLTQLAPAAKGDLVLVVSFAGKLPQHKTGDAGPPVGAPVQTGMATSRRRGRGRSSPDAGGARDPNELDISASFFSVEQHKPVAIVSMQYRGESVGDAMTRFAQELAHDIPGLHCAAWDWSVNIDPKSIHATVEEPAEPHE